MKNDESSELYASFLFPVINGVLYVGQRATEPYSGLFGPVGGKSEAVLGDFSPYTKDFPSLPKVASSDVLAQKKGLEYPHVSAIREFYEEIYDLSVNREEGLFDNLFRIGSIVDFFSDKKIVCSIYLATVPRKDFRLKPREMKSFVPITSVPVDGFFPLAKLSLFSLKKLLNQPLKIKKLEFFISSNLSEQIPDFDFQDISVLVSSYSTTMRPLIDLGAEKFFYEK